ncbi:universal stress protein [Flavobacterium sp. Sd200]|uniref:universal stress protein n=1 Tax=Flavobacterium sp. Sd200 TaxID=2692211 RepID=UPI00136B822C|nr:universal stress protein [Flavobacterium sp. Sd200]MXN92165.1 universal stress protein [Flavobacterium sp. Sd200]
MKKILVPTDFSEHAEYALKVAAQIARENDGEIFLLHLLELPGEESDAVTAGAEVPEILFFMQKAHERFEEVKSAEYLDGLVVTENVSINRAFDGILKVSKENDIDLIVMGSHGASGFHEMFIGSNTEKVVRVSEVPVLVIKKEEGAFNPEKFVFASNFTSEIKKPFAKVVDFANSFKSKLQLVYINTPNDFKSTHAAEKIIHDFVAGFTIENGYTSHIYNDVNIEKGVLHFANSINADLIGICTHGRQGIAHFFNGSVSEDLVNHAVRPVVTFKI